MRGIKPQIKNVGATSRRHYGKTILFFHLVVENRLQSQPRPHLIHIGLGGGKAQIGFFAIQLDGFKHIARPESRDDLWVIICACVFHEGKPQVPIELVHLSLQSTDFPAE
jgi:hypothetical protein